MQEMEQMISMYHAGFLICLVFSCIFFVITIALFFVFDIKKIFDMKTGRGAKRTIQKMEEINAKTGKLRQTMVGQTPSVLSPDERITYPTTVRTAMDPATSQNEENTASNQTEGTTETTVLMENQRVDIAEADLEKIELPGLFQIIKSTMWVHTEEII